MRLQQLDLLAFGPFTDVSLRFGETTGAVDIVYGPNEAGKSSALRGLRQFLYGIPTQTSDAFVHPYSDLRIGATLRDDLGRHQTMTRRKGRVNTLRAADDDEIISPEFLDDVLQGIDQDTFRLRFGIDYQSLTDGGRALVEGHGDLGKSLFSAATGIVRLSSVRQRLESLAGQLFKARGSKPRINAELKEYQQAIEELHNLELQSEQLQSREQELQQSERLQAELSSRIDRLQQDRMQLERALLALPHLERWDRLQTQLAMRDKATAVDANFHRRRRAAQDQLVRAEQLARQAEAELKSIHDDGRQVHVANAILEHRESIDAVHQRLDSYQLARKEVAELRPRQHAQTKALGERFPAFDASCLRQIDGSACARLQQLGEEKTQLDVTLEHQQASLNKALRELEQLATEPSAAEGNTDLDPLRLALEESQKDHSQIVARVELAQQMRENENQLVERLEGLQLWSGHPDELLALPVPEVDTISHFERELRSNAERISRLQKQQSDLKSAGETKLRQREQLRDQYSLPTEEELALARANRDGLWDIIVNRWTGQATTDQPGDDELQAQYADAVRTADDKADHLRRESDRVTQHQHLSADCLQLEAESDDVSKQFAAAAEEKRQLDAEWEAIWEASGVRPFAPAEMKAWVEKVADLKALIRAMHDSHRRLTDSEQVMQRLTGTLRSALRGLADNVDDERMQFEDLLIHARKTLHTLENSSGHQQLLDHRRKSLSDEISRLQTDTAAISGQVSVWQKAWDNSLAELGLSSREPVAPQQLVKQLVEASSLLADADRIADLLTKHERTITVFQADVAALSARLQLETPTDASEAVSNLFQQASAAAKQAARLEHMQQRRTECQSLLEEATKARHESESILADLCKLAGCETAEDLDRVEQQSRAADQIAREIREVASELERLADGAELSDFRAGCGESSPDELREKQKQIDAELAQLASRRQELSESVGRLNSQVESLGESHRVADMRTDIECLRATLGDDIRKYIRYQVAVSVLEGAIQRFRDRNQGPLLERASQIFQDLTLGGFSGLRSDYSEDGKAILVGVRHGGKIVEVEHMSEGTCDQLFLALRVAAMEHFLDHHEAIPFVLDDVLIKFDDARVAAALQVFSSLAQRTQVIFFTHHEHLLELAANQPDVEVNVHRLDGQPGSIKRTKTSRSRRKTTPSSRQRQLFPT